MIYLLKVVSALLTCQVPTRYIQLYLPILLPGIVEIASGEWTTLVMGGPPVLGLIPFVSVEIAIAFHQPS